MWYNIHCMSHGKKAHYEIEVIPFQYQEVYLYTEKKKKSRMIYIKILIHIFRMGKFQGFFPSLLAYLCFLIFL